MGFASEFLGGYRYIGYWNNAKGRKGSGNQYKVYNEKEVKNFLNTHNGLDNCGISITTFIEGIPHLLYLPFDFDSTNLRDAWLDAKKLYNFMVQQDYDVMLNFSGSKGFHVLVKVVPKSYTKNQIRYMQEFMKRYLKLDTSDENIIGDVRRLIRIPETHHASGNICETIAYNKGKLLNINKFTTVDTPRRLKNPPAKTAELKVKHKFPCVEKYIKDKDYWIKHHPRNSYEPSHRIRFAWAVLRIADKKTDDEIVEEAKSFGWWDYDEYKLRYQLGQIRGQGYINPSCETLKADGYCTIKDCPYLPWKGIPINKWRKNVKNGNM